MKRNNAIRKMMRMSFSAICLALGTLSPFAAANQSYDWDPCQCEGNPYTITLISSDGTYSLLPSTASYAKGTAVVASFTPDANHLFDSWMCWPSSHLASGSREAGVVVFITDNPDPNLPTTTTLWAVTIQKYHTVSLFWDRTRGSIEGFENTGSHTLTKVEYGSSGTLTAAPNSGYRTIWHGPVYSTLGQRYGDSVDFKITQDVELMAEFCTEESYPDDFDTLSVDVEGGDADVYTAGSAIQGDTAGPFIGGEVSAPGDFTFYTQIKPGYALKYMTWYDGQDCFLTQAARDHVPCNNYTIYLSPVISLDVQTEGQGVVTSPNFSASWNPQPYNNPSPTSVTENVHDNEVVMTPDACAGYRFDHWEYKNAAGEWVIKPNPYHLQNQKLTVYMNWWTGDEDEIHVPYGNATYTVKAFFKPLVLRSVRFLTASEVEGEEEPGTALTITSDPYISGSTTNNGQAYGAPQWKDDNQDGIPEREYPVGYVAGRRMQLNAVLGQNACGGSGLWCRASGGGFTFPCVAANESGVFELVADEAFAADTVRCFDPLSVTVEYSTDENGSSWKTAGATSNTVYVTAGAPQVPDNILYHTVVDIACRNADGMSDADDIVEAIWGEFSDRIVETLQPVPFETPPTGFPSGQRTLTYYADWDAVYHGLEENRCTKALLRKTDGDCKAWCSFFIDSTHIHGIIMLSRVPIVGLSVGPSDRNGIAIKSWSAPEPSQESLPNGWRNKNYGRVLGLTQGTTAYSFATPTEVSDIDGIDGQSNINPKSIFMSHEIVVISSSGFEGAIYDVSYGAFYNNIYDWQDNAIYGVVKIDILNNQWVLYYPIGSP